MDTGESRRVELILPMRTVLLVAATLGVLAAFAAIGDTFLVVFIGIFLALVFEYPVRFLMSKTKMSRGVAAAVVVLGRAFGAAYADRAAVPGAVRRVGFGTSSTIFLLPGRTAAGFRRALGAGRHRGGRERSDRRREGRSGRCRTRSRA